MIPEIISNYLDLIRNGINTNSYKLAWARAIVEICKEDRTVEKIRLDSIAKKMYKYYWNQTIYFDLCQGNDSNTRPEFLQIVRRRIEEYYADSNKNIPIHFERIEDSFSIDTKRIITILKRDVSWRFLKVRGADLNVYDYDKENNIIVIKEPNLLAEYAEIIYESINLQKTLH